MKSLSLILGLAAVLATSITLTVAFADQSSASAPKPSVDLIARGHYLVNRVGLCIDCHSPRNEKGEFIAGRHLTGAPIGVTPLAPMPWMPYAPRLAGLPAGFEEKEFIHFLMTGERPHGRGNPLPPMPPYRFEQQDAEAIAAYLRSLPVE